MLSIINAIVVTSQMMAIFFCAFFVVYLVALMLLPLERGLSKYIWDHTGTLKHIKTKHSFREFSQRHHG
jgi:hypothetical protein